MSTQTVTAMEAKRIGSAFLRECRKKMGWTQVDLAEKLNVSRGYIAQLESLRRPTRIPLEIIVHVARLAEMETLSLV